MRHRSALDTGEADCLSRGLPIVEAEDLYILSTMCKTANRYFLRIEIQHGLLKRLAAYSSITPKTPKANIWGGDDRGRKSCEVYDGQAYDAELWVARRLGNDEVEVFEDREWATALRIIVIIKRSKRVWRQMI